MKVRTWLPLAGLCLLAFTPQVASAQSIEQQPPKCGGWNTEVVASGLAPLENIAFDGDGRLLLSETDAIDPAGGRIVAVDPDGARRTLADVPSPGGIVVKNGAAYVNSGNGLVSGLLDRPDGSIKRVDLASGESTTVATGLTMPNGLAALPDNEWVVSRDLGPRSTLTRVGADGKSTDMGPWPTSTNGLAYDESRQALFVSSTFNVDTTIARVPIGESQTPPAEFRLPGFGPMNSADDIAFGPDGALYVTENVGSRLVRVDPDSGASCVVADQLWFASSVAQGVGPGWDPNALYVSSFLGTVTKLTA